MKKSTSDRYGLSWATDISSYVAAKLGKIPVPVLIVICGLIMISDGICVAKYNTDVSQLIGAGVWNVDSFRKIVWATVGMLIFDRLKMVSMKTFTMKKINIEYINIFRRIRKSKTADINEVTVGKAMDSATEMCKYQTDLTSYMFNMIPCFIPFIVMVWTVGKQSILMPVVIVASIAVALGAMVLCEKFFIWDEKAKKAKGKLKSVTTDNFMNITTCKYINEETYPDRRLLENQDETFKYDINVFRIFVYTLVIAALWTPTLVNAIIARNNFQSVTYIFINEYVIHNITNSLMNILENRIEYNNVKKNIETLKGDDVVSNDIFTGEMDLSGTSFAHKKDEDDPDASPVEFFIEDVKIQCGKRYLVEGTSGGGKSSFATWLAGGLKTKSGFDKKFMTYYIWQETSLFNDTLINNIIPNVEKNSEEYDNYIERLNYFKEQLDLTELIDVKAPKGWDSVVGERGCKLSSGEKQRINLIRALIAMEDHPEYIFILDEITSNLDSKTRKLAFELLNERCKSTLIIISHNKGFEKFVDYRIRVVNHRFKMVVPRTKKEIKVKKAG